MHSSSASVCLSHCRVTNWISTCCWWLPCRQVCGYRENTVRTGCVSLVSMEHFLHWWKKLTSISMLMNSLTLYRWKQEAHSFSTVRCYLIIFLYFVSKIRSGGRVMINIHWAAPGDLCILPFKVTIYLSDVNLLSKQVERWWSNFQWIYAVCYRADGNESRWWSL